jgi:hypothetical protein
MTAIKGSFDTFLNSIVRGKSHCLVRQAICHGLKVSNGIEDGGEAAGDGNERLHFWLPDRGVALQEDLQHKVVFWNHWLR